MSKIVDFRMADDRLDVIHQCVQLLADGELVAFPTEAEYIVVAQSLHSEAVGKLGALMNGGQRGALPLVIKGAQEARDYVPGMSDLGRKLTRRCWPGPVTIAFDVSHDVGFLNAIPAEARRLIVPDGKVMFRVPAHEVISEVLRLVPGPLVMLPETHADSPPLSTAEEAESRFGSVVARIIDAGTSRYGQTSTVIHVVGEGWEILQPGVVNEKILGRLGSQVVLFVCTGNTCRSPMAEGLFRKFLAERLQYPEDELFDRGFVVMSAGLAAASGVPASSESVTATKHQGVDLRAHESQPVTDQILNQADHIYTMTSRHRDSILAVRPDVADRVELLSREGRDISDPIGGRLEDYQNCEAEIEQNVRAILDDLDVK